MIEVRGRGWVHELDESGVDERGRLRFELSYSAPAERMRQTRDA